MTEWKFILTISLVADVLRKDTNGSFSVALEIVTIHRTLITAHFVRGNNLVNIIKSDRIEFRTCCICFSVR